jgi:tetratricopeptide (TPR) repeat protein
MQPSFADARRFRAEWLIRQGREPEAIEEYRAVVRLQPWGDSYAAALVGLGVLLERAGSIEEAKPWLVRAVHNAPGDLGTAEYLVEAARRLRERGRVREAIELLEHGAAAPGP